MPDYHPQLPDAINLALARHAELLDVAARQRLLAASAPPVRRPRGWWRQMRRHTGDLLIGWGLRLKAGTSLS